MRINLSLSSIVLAMTLLTAAAVILPRVRHSFSLRAASTSQAARPEQSTPENTVNAMFQVIEQGGAAADPKAVVTDRLDNTHLVSGRDMTSDEQRFAGLFWDYERSGAIYAYLRSDMTTSARISSADPEGDSAVVSVDFLAMPDGAQDWVQLTCEIDLKKRGPNWYVDDLKSTKYPAGVYTMFKKRIGSLE